LRVISSRYWRTPTSLDKASMWWLENPTMHTTLQMTRTLPPHKTNALPRCTQEAQTNRASFPRPQIERGTCRERKSRGG